MVKHAKTNLHFELERSISRKVDSKLIAYQVSLSDGFYDKYTKLWDKIYSFDFVINHRAFYAQLTKRCVYDVLLQTLEKISRKAITKQLAELEALVDVSESKEDFQIFFEKKYKLSFPDLKNCVYPKKKELSDFDQNLWIALHYNPRKERDT
ncbi:TPA: hypothetical protein TUO09_000235 [Streptococcus equi subsp. zooepidemicus]|nr:hypothetical protein [Streptococcus equi subsp. zooepidemicus]HEL0169960.1 hypothetical protein [Streptococcus equi subsp. zooepidemicus]HEL0186037.1 hypothetical protein [Streptococcus equi subsp. zooepidemicus]HEL0191954.1 hypothetical protein [Streptococcus equi subsp. zooepidemicus]HEL0197943.1 hypothetical protein [Streptococcus equi subsp. zooepidemicus]